MNKSVKLIFTIIFLLSIISVSCYEKGDSADQFGSENTKETSKTPKYEKDLTKNWKTVKRVIDGDTIVFNFYGGEEKVRLIGIDTPESVHPSKPVEPFAKEASEFTKKAVEGKEVWLEYDQERTDKYLRTLAYVHMEDGKVLNEELLRLGYARAYTEFPFKYKERYCQLEDEAKKAGRGLWGKKESPQTPVVARNIPKPIPKKTTPPPVRPTPKPRPKPVPKPRPAPKPAVRGYVTVKGYWASTSKAKLEKLIDLLASGDYDAADLYTKLNPDVFMLKGGLKVHLVDSTWLGSLVKIRPHGQLIEVWTVKEAIGK